mgnify:CR=1 FL=1
MPDTLAAIATIGAAARRVLKLSRGLLGGGRFGGVCGEGGGGLGGGGSGGGPDGGGGEAGGLIGGLGGDGGGIFTADYVPSTNFFSSFGC